VTWELEVCEDPTAKSTSKSLLFPTSAAGVSLRSLSLTASPGVVFCVYQRKILNIWIIGEVDFGVSICNIEI
jgi:hypothetical protein